MLKLVAKGFYNELINYGVRRRGPPGGFALARQSIGEGKET